MEVIESIKQTEFDDGIQSITVYVGGVGIPQKWEWPECRAKGDAGSYSLHELFLKLFKENMEVNELYLFITQAAKLVSGNTISQALPAPGASTDDTDVTTEADSDVVADTEATESDDMGDSTEG